MRRAFGALRQDMERINAPPASNAEAYRDFKCHHEVKRLMEYLNDRYEGGIESDTVVRLVDRFFNECPETLDAVCRQRGLYNTAWSNMSSPQFASNGPQRARASYIRVTSKLSGCRYECLIHAPSKRGSRTQPSTRC